MPATRPLALLITSAALAACGGAGSGAAPTAASGDARPSCTAAASVSLQPGQTQTLTADEAACFRLAAGENAEYALAGYDARALEASRAGQSAGSLAEPRYTIADATHGGAAQSLVAAPSGSTEPLRPADVRFTTAAATDAADPFSRATPWREGERFQVKPLEGSTPVQARVVRVVGGRFALAVVERDEAGASKVLEQATEALRFLAQRGVPLLQSTFSDAIPTTTDGSGQLLVLATAWDPAKGAAATWTREDAAGAHSFVWLNLNLRPGKGTGYEVYDHTSYRVKVLGHELTHAWQAAWLHQAHASGHAAAQAPAWSMEGGADFVAMDLVRRYLNVGLGANWKWSDNLEPSKEGVVFALEPFDARGRLTWGYYDASSLLRDLQARLISAGMSPEAAMAEVSRGAVEGWHGSDGEGGDCAGLVERMRARLGSAWDPAGAVLLWTASQAADDRTPNAALSNPTYYNVGSADERYGWKPAAEVRGGSGQSAAVTQVAGGSFYVRVKGARAESTLRAVSSTPDARWMIVRVR
ncbi:MAG TPA: hypothetical protein VHG93_05400 [Longimicrobium sp.]|nr:hypothetical protein [Longimicrobium sp.]